MTRTDTAICCLLASAFILGAMLMYKVADYTQGMALERTAQAEMVTNARSVSVLTTLVDRQKEMIYVLDSSNEILIGYMLDFNKNRLEPMGKLDIGDLMKRGDTASGGGGTTRRGR